MMIEIEHAKKLAEYAEELIKIDTRIQEIISDLIEEARKAVKNDRA